MSWALILEGNHQTFTVISERYCTMLLMFLVWNCEESAKGWDVF